LPRKYQRPLLNSIIDACRTWFWDETKVDLNDCDFERQRLKSPFDFLGLSAKPKGKGGDNDCYKVGHYDEDALREAKPPLQIPDQKYEVNGKEYTACD
jgi:hypothetical protein